MIDAQLRRAAGDPGIAEGLAGVSKARVEAAWALGRIGGRSARERLMGLLDGEVEREGDLDKTLAVLALLEPTRSEQQDPAWKALEDALWRRYALTEDASSASSLLLAIARVGGGDSVKRLVREMSAPPEEDSGPEAQRYGDAMRALGILCSRGEALDASGRDAVSEQLRSINGSVREGVLFVLGRCAQSSAETFAMAEERRVMAQRIMQRLDGASPEEARLAWLALRRLGELPEGVPAAILSAEGDPWMVEVEAARALAASPKGRQLAFERLADVPLQSFSGARIHVLLEFVRGLRVSVATDAGLAESVRELTTRVDGQLEGANERRRVELSLLRCELALLLSVRSGLLEQLRSCRELGLELDPTPQLEVDALLAMNDRVLSKQQRATELLVRAKDPDARRAAPAIAALAEVDDSRVEGALLAALEREDLGVLAAAAATVAARSLDAGKRSLEVVPALRRTVSSLNNADAIEARLSAIEALGVLARRPEKGVNPESSSTSRAEAPWLESVLLPLARDPAVSVRRRARHALRDRPDLLARFDEPVPLAGRDAFGSELEAMLERAEGKVVEGIAVTTSGGRFVIDLRGGNAPINRANLIDLVDRGFYDGLAFHRVVPGFVIQGGDPRGDGYGGPGYLVPCEWSNHRYERGVVGIALAGKDTGGSQIFVAQSPQPHLDGRFTVVGKVIEGMDVVDATLPGDRIVKVELLEKLATAPAKKSGEGNKP
jgi:cyclophilin family peptidyl-prolyl cis-trans isomerase